MIREKGPKGVIEGWKHCFLVNRKRFDYPGKLHERNLPTKQGPSELGGGATHLWVVMSGKIRLRV